MHRRAPYSSAYQSVIILWPLLSHPLHTYTPWGQTVYWSVYPWNLGLGSWFTHGLLKNLLSESMNEYMDAWTDEWRNMWISEGVIKCTNRWLRKTLKSTFVTFSSSPHSYISKRLSELSTWHLCCHVKLNQYKPKLYPSWSLISFLTIVLLFFPRSPSQVLWLVHSVNNILYLCVFWAVCYMPSTVLENGNSMNKTDKFQELRGVTVNSGVEDSIADNRQVRS